MMDPGDQIHLGFKPVMPSYQGVITSSEVAALVEYIRSLRDVNPSDGQQPLPVEVPGNVPLVNPPESEIRGATR
jgi:cytochrome c oxidase subunit 2